MLHQKLTHSLVFILTMSKPELDIYVWFLQLFDQIMFLFETDIADMKREKHKYLLSTFLTIIVATLMGNQLRQRNSE